MDRHEGRLRLALALGSGGLRGMAHIGVLRALEEAEIRPTLYAGSSAGALVAAAAAHRIGLADLEAIADRLWRKPVFQVDFLGLLRRGFRTPGVYRSAPLKGLCDELFGDVTFRQLQTSLVVSSVDIESGAPLCWGVASLPDVPVADAVYASCAMPGLLPPGLVGGRRCMDGAVVDPLALRAVAPLADVVIAVVLEDTPASRTVGSDAAPALWLHAQGIATRDLARHTLARWDGPPLLLVRPQLRGVHPLRGGDPHAMIQAGYEAARTVIDRWDRYAVSVDDVTTF